MDSSASFALFAGMALFSTIIGLAFYVVIAIGLWKVFEKAGKPGWAAIVPFYNLYLLIEIVGRPMWFFLCMLAGVVFFWIPILNLLIWLGVIVLWLMVSIDLAKSFGKDPAFGVGIFFLSFIFIPILGFGDSKYIGPAAQSEGIKEQIG